MRKIEIISKDMFEPDNHFYPKALNSTLHPMVGHFFNLDYKQIVSRYIHLNPQVNGKFLESILHYTCSHFHWGGADLFYVTTETGRRGMVVLETNSCPSGQKSMPIQLDSDEYRGYRQVIEKSFLPQLKKKRLPKGGLAVIYDKNYMESAGYAATLADLTGEDVYLVSCYLSHEPQMSFENGVLHIHHQNKKIPIRAAYRYVTQKPWSRIPPQTKTFIYNSTLVCLSGGRNKLVANKAYEFFNTELMENGLRIHTPETIRDVSKVEIPLWVTKFGGKAVIKNPYSNAGQGVYTITTQEELDAFMAEENSYDQFIVQGLIGHHNWSSHGERGALYHIATVPNKKGSSYIADLRVMVINTPNGFLPCAVYARRAKSPMKANLPSSSWDVLGTNLSIKRGDDLWDSDTSRLMLMDQRDFNNLGIGVDDLIEAYIQTVMSIIAIDKMAINLISSKGTFRKKLFRSLDNDDSLIQEIILE